MDDAGYCAFRTPFPTGCTVPGGLPPLPVHAESSRDTGNHRVLLCHIAIVREGYDKNRSF